jgi:RNA-directed DNA polymerase
MITQSTILTSDPSELRRNFFALQKPQDIAAMLEVEYYQLIYHLYIVPEDQKYKTFSIPKKRGGERQILAPITPLKLIQQKLNQVLQAVYHPKQPVHGFIQAFGKPSRVKNILTNAKPHVGQRYVFNIDLEDFFTTINFGRVRGMFMAKPYNLNPSVASTLAKICCHNGFLPQGAPTSPTVSNMVCAKLDSDLVKLAKSYKCIYTRYADDITFSSYKPHFPLALAITTDVGQIDVGNELKGVIERNGFTINQSKTRLQTKNRRQEVTGLVVNKFPNVNRKLVREIRAMINDWCKDYATAEQRFLAHFDKKKREYEPNKPIFKYVVKGKVEFLGQIRGKNDFIYLKFCRQLKELDPELMKHIPDQPSVSQEDIDHQEWLLNTHRRNVATLIQQIALIGILVPLQITNQLHDEREKIKRIKQILRGWNVPVKDHPDDDAPKRDKSKDL